jgi:hypothetical protein
VDHPVQRDTGCGGLSQRDGRHSAAHSSQDHVMTTHKFQVGQIVQYTPSLRFSDAASGIYKIAKRMPEQNGEFTYRILGRGEMQVRNARESELCELDEAP